jgi:hypothetical protein
METTLQDKINFEMSMYGMTLEDLRAQVEDSVFDCDYNLMAMSMISDAQDMVYKNVTPEVIESQRQLLNRAKYVLRFYTKNKETT